MKKSGKHRKMLAFFCVLRPFLPRIFAFWAAKAVKNCSFSAKKEAKTASFLLEIGSF